jgi:presenilin-like A22 family membrane protease
VLFALIRPQFSFWEAVALLVLVSGWDAYNLFATQAQVVASAAQVDPFAPGGNLHAVGLPKFIGIGAHLAPLSTYAAYIGIGDLTLPGLLIVAAGRTGKLAKAPQLYWTAMGAYAASLVVVVITSSVTSLAIPVLPFATVAIVPAVALAAWRTGSWRSLSARHLPAVSAAPVTAEKASEAQS